MIQSFDQFLISINVFLRHIENLFNKVLQEQNIKQYKLANLQERFAIQHALINYLFEIYNDHSLKESIDDALVCIKSDFILMKEDHKEDLTELLKRLYLYEAYALPSQASSNSVSNLSPLIFNNPLVLNNIESHFVPQYLINEMIDSEWYFLKPAFVQLNEDERKGISAAILSDTPTPSASCAFILGYKNAGKALADENKFITIHNYFLFLTQGISNTNISTVISQDTDGDYVINATVFSEKALHIAQTICKRLATIRRRTNEITNRLNSSSPVETPLLTRWASMSSFSSSNQTSDGQEPKKSKSLNKLFSGSS